MKRSIALNMKNLLTGTLILSSLFIMASCSKNDNGGGTNPGQPQSTSDSLMAVSSDSTSGNVMFQYTPGTDGVMVTVHLNNTPSGTHPAKIYMGNAADAGSNTAITLNAVDGSGTSTTQVTQFDNGAPFTYDSSLNYNGYLQVMMDNSSGQVLAQGDIGQNALTGTSMSYGINQIETSALTGNITFYQRKNNQTLAVINLYLAGTNSMVTDGAVLPAKINKGSISNSGAPIIGLNPVTMHINNTSIGMGQSYTNINSYVENNVSQSIKYSDVLKLDASVQIYYSNTNLVAAAQGNIGKNK